MEEPLAPWERELLYGGNVQVETETVTKVKSVTFGEKDLDLLKRMLEFVKWQAPMGSDIYTFALVTSREINRA